MPSEEVSTVSYQYSMPGVYTVTAVFTDVPGVSEVDNPKYVELSVAVFTERKYTVIYYNCNQSRPITDFFLLFKQDYSAVESA